MQEDKKVQKEEGRSCQGCQRYFLFFFNLAWLWDGSINNNQLIQPTTQTILDTHTHTHRLLFLISLSCVRLGLLISSLDTLDDASGARITWISCRRFKKSGVQTLSNPCLPCHGSMDGVWIWQEPEHNQFSFASRTQLNGVVRQSWVIISMHNDSWYNNSDRMDVVSMYEWMSVHVFFLIQKDFSPPSSASWSSTWTLMLDPYSWPCGKRGSTPQSAWGRLVKIITGAFCYDWWCDTVVLVCILVSLIVNVFVAYNNEDTFHIRDYSASWLLRVCRADTHSMVDDKVKKNLTRACVSAKLHVQRSHVSQIVACHPFSHLSTSITTTDNPCFPTRITPRSAKSHFSFSTTFSWTSLYILDDVTSNIIVMTIRNHQCQPDSHVSISDSLDTVLILSKTLLLCSTKRTCTDTPRQDLHKLSWRNLAMSWHQFSWEISMFNPSRPKVPSRER